MAQRPDYSIIIPAYNEEECLPATLRSVCKAMRRIEGLHGEVIVSDNASTDSTAAVARSYGALVVHEPHRQIARARNAGAACARGRCFIFLDADTLISVSLLAAALRALESGNICGGGALVRMDRRLPLSSRVFMCAWTAMSRLCRWAAGSFVYCLREAFEDIAGFDETYYASEEIHFSKALRRWGEGRGMRFTIFSHYVVTSGRKLTWYTNRDGLRFLHLMIRDRKALKKRETSWFWYERPVRNDKE